jgi:cell division protein FtsL
MTHPEDGAVPIGLWQAGLYAHTPPAVRVPVTQPVHAPPQAESRRRRVMQRARRVLGVVGSTTWLILAVTVLVQQWALMSMQETTHAVLATTHTLQERLDTHRKLLVVHEQRLNACSQQFEEPFTESNGKKKLIQWMP